MSAKNLSDKVLSAATAARSRLELSLAGLEHTEDPVTEAQQAQDFRRLELLGDALPLHEGVKRKVPEIQNEKPIHRTMAYMYAMGSTLKEIAEFTGYTEIHVGTVANQPWFKDNVARLVHDEMNDDFSHILKAGSMEAVMVIREMVNDKTVAPSIRLSASKDLVDRFRGKPTQHTVLTSAKVAPVDVYEEKEKLTAELEAI